MNRQGDYSVILFALAMATLLSAGIADAAPVFTEVNSPGSGGGTSPGDPGELEYAPDVSATDLLAGLVPTTTGTWAGDGAPALNDGVHGDSFDNTGTVSDIAWPTVGSTVTFDLGLGANGLGYDISSIQSIAAWQSAGFGNQGYTVEVQPVGDSFTPLATVLYNPLGGGAGATKVTLIDDGAGPGGNLATGIEAIRFTQDSVPGTSGNRVTYREIDIEGQPTGDDDTPPTLSTLSPADDATEIAAGTSLVATFSEPIMIGTGDITIKDLDAPSQTAIPVGDAQISVSGAVLTIDPGTDLDPSTDYAIQIAATAIDDLTGNSFAGIADDETWNFTTAAPDLTDPAIVFLDPADDASEVALGSSLVLTFDESIAIGTGDITIKNLSAATETLIAVTDSTQVSIDGAILTIDPVADLDPSTEYAIQIAATAIDDLAGNSFAGISDDETWNFSTAALVAGPTITEMFSTTELEYVDDVSDSDLLHGLVATETANWNMGGGATPANLNDGTHGPSFDDVAGVAVATIAWTTVGATATYELGPGEGGSGWDITSIQSIAAWNSANFGNQGFTVEVQGVGEVDFTTLATVDSQPLTEGPGATKVTLTDGGGVLASGVEFIRFTANSINGGDNGGAFTFREIDVEGVESGALPQFAITAILYSPADDMLTLTWRSRPGKKYGVFFSSDLAGWGADLNDSITGDAGETTTASFDLSLFGLGEVDDLFFRVEESE